MTNYSRISESTEKRSIIDRYFAYLKQLPLSDSFLIRALVVVFFISVVWAIASYSVSSQVEVPATGGSFIEGVQGTPRFVNPVLAVSRADRDLSALIYDGLMKVSPEGTLIPHVAESVTLSDDGLTYNVALRHDVLFQDGTPLTARDVLFTMSKLQAPTIASPLRNGFEGVSVEQLGEYELNFVLTEPYAPFIENLTFGILPEHLWKDASDEEFPFSQLNTEPIGSGPYKIDKIIRSKSGIPEEYILAPNDSYFLGPAKIGKFSLRFVSNEDALISLFKSGEIDALSGIDPSRLPDLSLNPETHGIIALPLPRTFALFFNQNRSLALRDKGAREALNIAIDKNALIDAVLHGYGTPLDSPIPPGFGFIEPKQELSTSTFSRVERADAILRNAGWNKNEKTGGWEKKIDGTLTSLAFSISTLNSPLFESTAEFLRASWAEIGVPVTIRQFEQTDLTQSVIRPRDYESLLFGIHVGRALDYYPFWHSSQRNDPGLNVSLYANLNTDQIVTDARKKTTQEGKQQTLEKFVTDIRVESPAIFLFAPKFLYIFPHKVLGTSFSGIVDSSERFANVEDWYTKKDSIWPIFRNETENTETNK